MINVKTMVLVAVTASMAACGMEPDEGDATTDPFKPEDASELEGSNLGKAQAAHTQHYVDATTNQWMEPNYPMGVDNPNCKDWYVYDRFLNAAPPIGTSNYSTYQTSHPIATGPYVKQFLDQVKERGYNPDWLLDHNSVVARVGTEAGRCSGRYILQWHNRPTASATTFLSSTYRLFAWVPTTLFPGAERPVATVATQEACAATDREGIPFSWIDLYVCEASAGFTGSVSGWCVTRGKPANLPHWRKAGSAYGRASYNSAYNRCDTTSYVSYTPPPGKVAVNFNMVVKTGIGHAVAPAQIQIYRVN